VLRDYPASVSGDGPVLVLNHALSDLGKRQGRLPLLEGQVGDNEGQRVVVSGRGLISERDGSYLMEFVESYIPSFEIEVRLRCKQSDHVGGERRKTVLVQGNGSDHYTTIQKC
jgi:hypothetical protein